LGAFDADRQRAVLQHVRDTVPVGDGDVEEGQIGVVGADLDAVGRDGEADVGASRMEHRATGLRAVPVCGGDKLAGLVDRLERRHKGTLLASSSPVETSTSTARPNSVPKSTPMAYFEVARGDGFINAFLLTLSLVERILRDHQKISVRIWTREKVHTPSSLSNTSSSSANTCLRLNSQDSVVQNLTPSCLRWTTADPGRGLSSPAPAGPIAMRIVILASTKQKFTTL
jgi:hypothetical protein